MQYYEIQCQNSIIVFNTDTIIINNAPINQTRNFSTNEK